ncbi:MAG: SUF system NifU family Fe-S cluster assembly protein [Bacilli bacterium]|nr:SUF system NifU family Fe-S cluster assembly protein [Bacilli bacterium]
MPTSIEVTPQMMREIIMDHYQNPRHKSKPTESGYLSLHASSTNCIDDFDVYLLAKDGKIADARWEGVACTISSASTDILCDRVIGMTFKEARYVIEQYLNMIGEKEYDASVLDEAIVFLNTGKQAARIHCATMGWTALKELLEKEEK